MKASDLRFAPSAIVFEIPRNKGVLLLCPINNDSGHGCQHIEIRSISFIQDVLRNTHNMTDSSPSRVLLKIMLEEMFTENGKKKQKQKQKQKTFK